MWQFRKTSSIILGPGGGPEPSGVSVRESRSTVDHWMRKWQIEVWEVRWVYFTILGLHVRRPQTSTSGARCKWDALYRTRDRHEQQRWALDPVTSWQRPGMSKEQQRQSNSKVTTLTFLCYLWKWSTPKQNKIWERKIKNLCLLLLIWI